MKANKSFLALAILTAMLACSVTVKAQMMQDAKKYYKGTSVTLKLGVTSAYTDIRTFDFARVSAGDPKVSEWKPGFGISINRMCSSVLGLQANFLYGKLLGIADYRNKVDIKAGHFYEDANVWRRLGFTEPI